MGKLLTTGLIAFNIALTDASFIYGQGMVVETKECINAIASVESQLQNERALTIELSEISDRYISGTPPEGRPHQYVFGMGGGAVETVMNSPVLLNSLASRIISNCNSISSVSFAQYRSGWFWVFGLMPSGKVEFFRCPEDHFHGGGYRDLVWGESCPV